MRKKENTPNVKQGYLYESDVDPIGVFVFLPAHGSLIAMHRYIGELEKEKNKMEMTKHISIGSQTTDLYRCSNSSFSLCRE